MLGNVSNLVHLVHSNQSFNFQILVFRRFCAFVVYPEGVPRGSDLGRGCQLHGGRGSQEIREAFPGQRWKEDTAEGREGQGNLVPARFCKKLIVRIWSLMCVSTT